MSEQAVIHHGPERPDQKVTSRTERLTWDKEAARLVCELLPALQRKAAAMSLAQAAEDIVQTACERLLRRSVELVNHPNPRAYALRTVTTIVYDLHRTRRRETSFAEVPDTATAHAPMDFHEAQWEVNRLLGLLSAGQASAIRLVDIDGHSIDHAAVLLGVHRGTVSQARSRGLRKLHKEVRVPSGR